MNTQPNANDLKQKINRYLEELAAEIDLARKSESMQKYLDFMGRFHQYSPSNIWLILFAKPDATNVAGFQTWKKLGRFVKKGEKGIPIFAPLIHKEDPDNDNSPKILNGFRIVHVFDVSQTDGESLPPIPQWISPEQNLELKQKLISFAESKGIQVLFKELPGNVQGVSKGGSIEISPTAGTKTIIHELGHELMHRSEGATSNPFLREMEAEAIAYSVAKYLGINNLNSPNYIVLNGSTSEDIRNAVLKIYKVVEDIINSIET